MRADLPKKLREHPRTLLPKEASYQLRFMIKCRIVEQLIDRTRATALVVHGAHHHPRDAGQQNGSGTHRAGLKRRVQGRILQPKLSRAALRAVNRKPLRLLAVGMTFVIISGGIDLSVGAVIALSAVIMGMLLKLDISVSLAILAGLVSGILIGTISGFIISRVGINPLIVTLSMMSIIRGSVILVTGGKPIFGFDRSFTWWGSAGESLINPPIALSLFVFLLGLILLKCTKFGQYVFALGSNSEALRRTGVNVNRYRRGVFAISGLCAAMAGFIVAARLNTAEPLAGLGYEMDAIAAVVLGGTSIKGGSGTLLGTLIACIILAVMKNGLNILSISSNYQQLLTGLIVMASVGIAEFRKKSEKER